MTTAKLILAICCLLSGIQAESFHKSEVQLYTGVLEYDLSGVGVENHLGIGYLFGINQFVGVKSLVTYVGTHQQYSLKVPYLIPEFGFEIGKEFKFVKPYFGFGGGMIVDLRNSMPDSVTYVKEIDSGSDKQRVIETIKLPKASRLEASAFSEVGFKWRISKGSTFVNTSMKVRAHELDMSGGSSEFSIGLGSIF